MPYLRLTSAALPLETKRELARDLTAATLTALTLPDEDRMRTTVHFTSYQPEDFAIGGVLIADGQASDYTLEFTDRDLTLEKKQALVQALTPIVMQGLGLGTAPGDAFKVNIIFRHYAAEDMAIGGHFLPELYRMRQSLRDREAEKHGESDTSLPM